MEIENWTPVKDYETRYEISSLGRIKTIGSEKSKRSALSKTGSLILSPSTSKKGYKRIGLVKDNKRTYFSMHRLVATAFIPNPENKPCVNHINGIKNDNRIENLEWCTQSENVKHGFDVLNRVVWSKGKTGSLSHLAKKVRCIDTGEIFNSLFDAAKKIRGNSGNITMVCKGKGKTYKGFKWEYYEPKSIN